MLQFKLDSLDGLEESQKALYIEKEGKFYLNVSGVVADDEVAGLRANRDELLEEKKREKEARDKAEAERQRIEREALEEKARKDNNIEAIENSWKEKFSNRENELNEKLKASEAKNYELTVGRLAQEMAGKLAKPNAQRLLAKEIKERLSLDENGNIRVLDLQGKPSALTIDELESQLKNDPTYQDIIVINNSSGGGANGGGFGGGATKKAEEYSEQERRDMKMSNPEMFKQMFLSK